MGVVKTIPEKLLKVWKPALQEFTKAWPHFETVMLHQLIDSVSPQEPVLETDFGNGVCRHSLLSLLTFNKNTASSRNMSLRVAWFSYFLKSLCESKNQNAASIIFAAIKECTKNMNTWSRIMLEELLKYNSDDVSAKVVQKLAQLGDFHAPAAKVRTVIFYHISCLLNWCVFRKIGNFCALL